MLKVQEFILNNDDWEEKLQSKPYCLKVGRNDGYVILKYSQIESDFSEQIVCESRGIILDEENDYQIVCKPFNKFFNYGEHLASEIDWPSAKIQEKVDGSIMKLWWSERFSKWVVSTNGTIFAQNADLPFADKKLKTFLDMFMEAYNKVELFGSPIKGDTHVFEMVGRNNRVVIPYEDIELFYLISINNENFAEYKDDFFINFKRPKEYSFSSLEETIAFTKTKDFNTFRNEGFVVSDRYHNRIKIKTEDYLRIHRMRGETNPTPLRFLELLKTNEVNEFLSYFPEYKKDYENFKKKYIEYQTKLDDALNLYFTIKDLPRKDFALKAKETISPTFLFGLLDEKWTTSNEYMQQMREKNLVEVILK